MEGARATPYLSDAEKSFSNLSDKYSQPSGIALVTPISWVVMKSRHTFFARTTGSNIASTSSGSRREKTAACKPTPVISPVWLVTPVLWSCKIFWATASIAVRELFDIRAGRPLAEAVALAEEFDRNSTISRRFCVTFQTGSKEFSWSKVTFVALFSS